MIVLVTTHHGSLADSFSVDLEQLLADDDGLREVEPAIRLALHFGGEFRCGGGAVPEMTISLSEEPSL